MNTSDITKQLSKPIERIRRGNKSATNDRRNWPWPLVNKTTLIFCRMLDCEEQADYLCIDGVYIRTLLIPAIHLLPQAVGSIA